MADPVAWFGAISGAAGLGVAVWTRVAQARYWKLEPIRERQRALRLEVLGNARKLLDEVKNSRTAAARLLELEIGSMPASKVIDYAISRDETVRFANQEVPRLIVQETVTLLKWDTAAYEYARADKDFRAKQQIAAQHSASPRAEDHRRSVDDARDARNACARRLETCAESAEESLARIIHTLERMDYSG